MATTKEYMDFVCDQLNAIGGVPYSYKKMFGEYLVYINQKPAILVCDNTVFVKKLPRLAELLEGVPEGAPYEGAKPHYILDMENRELTERVIAVLTEEEK